MARAPIESAGTCLWVGRITNMGSVGLQFHAVAIASSRGLRAHMGYEPSPRGVCRCAVNGNRLGRATAAAMLLAAPATEEEHRQAMDELDFGP